MIRVERVGNICVPKLTLKALLVAKGFSQVDGVDFSKTFSLVVKPASIHVVPTIAIVKQ